MVVNFRLRVRICGMEFGGARRVVHGQGQAFFEIDSSPNIS
jgi:hypothetical protein